MRVRKPVLIALSLVIFLSMGSLCEVFADAPGWTLTQRSEYMGDQYVYVSKEGFKWVSPKAGANIVTRAPNWLVTMFNDKTRQYYQTTFQKWRDQMVSTGGKRARDMQAARWVKGKSGNISGLKATQYVMAGAGTGKLSAVKRASCWVSDEIEVPAPIAEVLNRAYGLPNTKYFPLKVTYVTSRGQVKVALDTYRSDTCSIPTKYFNAPTGYQLASSQAEIVMDDETRQILRDMAGDLESNTGPKRRAPARVKKAPQTQAQAKPKPKPGSTADQLTKLLESLKGCGGK